MLPGMMWDAMWDMVFYRLRKYSNLLPIILSQEKNQIDSKTDLL